MTMEKGHIRSRSDHFQLVLALARLLRRGCASPVSVLVQTIGRQTASEHSRFDAVGMAPRATKDRWENFQLQLSFERQASILDGYLIQFVRAGVEFLARILQQKLGCS